MPCSAAEGMSLGPSASPRRSPRPRSCSPRPTRRLGLTNRALASRARRVCLAFPLEGRDGNRCRVAGPPGPGKSHRPRARPRQLGSAPGRPACHLAAWLARRALDQPRRDRSVRPTRRTGSCTSPGTRDYPDLKAPGPHYVLLDYSTPFGVALAAADVAVAARAARSSSSRPCTSLPAILVPYPHAAADHQRTNAA